MNLLWMSGMGGHVSDAAVMRITWGLAGTRALSSYPLPRSQGLSVWVALSPDPPDNVCVRVCIRVCGHAAV